MSTSEINEQKPMKINGITNGHINENGKSNGITKDTEVKTPTTNGTNFVNGVAAMNSPVSLHSFRICYQKGMIS
ncbi:hypothetical protein ACQ4LE_009751 [Meloidogyne hapla]